MKTTSYQVTIIFLTPVLGSQPSDPEIASKFIAKRKGLEMNPEGEDELLPEAIERGTTVFHRTPGDELRPCLLNYQLLGFLKEAARVQNGRVAGGVKNLRAKVEQNVFVSPRILPLNVPTGGEIDYLERPLRAETARGPMVTLARSEMLPEGTWFKAGIQMLDGPVSEEILHELFDYGFYRGLGLWRNSGAYGTFRYELIKED